MAAGLANNSGNGPSVIAPITPYLKPMRPEDILLPTPAGVYSKIGGFYIDPPPPVDKAVITHGHSDHARAGHGAVLATQETLDLMRLRYGETFAVSTQAVRFGEILTLGGARVTFHSAGHVLGSAQIAIEANGLRIVASGDYKTVVDPIRPASRSNSSLATYSSPRPRSDCRSFVTATPTPRSQSSCVQSNYFLTALISSEPIRSARHSA